jgi:cytochrome c oxidase subunit 1/cytochrome c oxidase subunit I+III
VTTSNLPGDAPAQAHGNEHEHEHEEARGLYAWFSTVDHKRIGIMYMLAALFFFAVGGVEALVMRLQLAKPENALISPDAFNQLFTMHGTTMIFLVAMPAIAGFSNYVVPLMIGARDMAFPRLNALSFWLVPLGGFLLHFSLAAGGAPAAGWFSYAPLAETPYNSTPGTDYWVVALLVLGVGSVATAINMLATILTLRAPGMTLRRLPLFVWITLVTAILIILALPVLNASIVMLLIDRQLEAHFFTAVGGGNAVMWQHFFWTFGHPEVYILALPAFGVICEVIPVFSRKPIFGYEFIAASSVAIAILSFGVWAHHMFAVGLGHTADSFFVGGSMLIAVPTGVKVFNWIGTMWRGQLRFTVAMMYATAFIVQFVVGGLSGITFAAAPLDWQTTDTYYVVAHFHYIIVGGIVFALLAGTYYWFPKMTGKLLDERLGKLNFWTMVLGFNLTFFVQHLLGLMGMPRRVFTYPDLPGYGALNLVSTVGAFVMGVSVLVLLWNVVKSLRSGKAAGDNPWDAWTLEWATTSPPDPHNFEEVPPVHGRRPLYDLAKSKEAKPAAAVRTFEKGAVLVTSFIASEASFFVILIFAYVFYNAYLQPGGPTAKGVLDVQKAGIYTGFLLASSGTLWLSEKALDKSEHARARFWLAVTIALGAVFLVGQAREYIGLYTSGTTLTSNLFATTFFTLTGFHGLHVTAGLVALGIVLVLSFMGDLARKKTHVLKNVGLYWHFVDVVWIVVFSVVYIRGTR